MDRMQVAARIPASGIVMIAFLTFMGCASYRPQLIKEVPFQKRAHMQVENNVRVTAAVLSAEESEQVFDVPLYNKGIQPVWLEIENNDEKPVWFLPVSLDRDYFAPLEVAYMHRFKFSKKANQQIEQYFNEQAMGLYIGPGSIRSGFVFTNLDMGTKCFDVDLVGEDHQVRTFTFFINVPGLRVDHHEVNWDDLYPKNQIVSYDERGLRKALESLPCCTTNQDGTKKGDPLNLVLIGTAEDVHHALIRSGWDETGIIGATSATKTERSFSVPREYRYVPMSPLYFYGRPQDVAFRKSRERGYERNQLRLWLSPMMFEGKPVWVGQINRDVQARSGFERYQIEPDADRTRRYLIQDLMYSGGLAKYAYVKGVGAASMSEPRQNFDGDTYFTDGHRAVLWVSSDPISLTEVEFVEWQMPQERKRL